MPPLKGIDRGLNGETLKALEESGHGRRLAIVDASYNIPRWAQKADYRGETSADALEGVLKLTPVDEGYLMIMDSDDSGEGSNSNECEAETRFHNIVEDLDMQGQLEVVSHPRLGETGFYAIANNQEEDTLFIRTLDTLPYACASFVIGHSQEV